MGTGLVVKFGGYVNSSAFAMTCLRSHGKYQIRGWLVFEHMHLIDFSLLWRAPLKLGEHASKGNFKSIMRVIFSTWFKVAAS